jgi:hypothetical protein
MSRTSMPRTNIVHGLSHAEYAQLGAEIDCDATEAQLSAFFRKFHQSTDQAMAALATYASFKFHAVRARLDGDIATALEHEATCELIFNHEITPANRW